VALGGALTKSGIVRHELIGLIIVDFIVFMENPEKSLE